MTDADAAATNAGRKQAVALAHPGDDAPRVVAKGYGDLADAILAKAKEHGIYTHQSPAIVRLLMRSDLDDRIPSELYRAVAELLVWVHDIEAQSSRGEADGG